MSLKMIWDFIMYWGSIAPLYTHNKLHNIDFMHKVDSTLSDFGLTGITMQIFFRNWTKLDNKTMPPGFLDYSKIKFLADLNEKLLEDLDSDQVYTDLQNTLQLAREVQQEIINRATESFPELELPENTIDKCDITHHMDAIFETLHL